MQPAEQTNALSAALNEHSNVLNKEKNVPCSGIIPFPVAIRGREVVKSRRVTRLRIKGHA
jgi:hypothetical protein